MAVSRRQFLTLVGGSTAGAIIFQACGVPEQELFVQSPVGMPEDLVTGIDNWYATVCRQCPTPEGIVVRVMEGRAKKIEGNVDYPINRGKHSARCEAGLQALYHPDRVRGPLLRVGERGSGGFREISWDDAISRVTAQLSLLRNSGNQNGMVMVTNPLGAHLETVVDRFVSGYGGRHIPYEPLEQTNLRRAVKDVFNQDVLPDFDLEHSDFVLSFGADFLNTWLSPVRYGRGYGEFRQGERERGTMYHVDSHFSMTAANADKWVYIKPGMEGILALSIAQVIISEGLGDSSAANALTGNGAIDLNAFTPESVAGRTGVSADKIRTIAHEFAGHEHSIAIGGGSSGAHTNGLFNLKAIYSLNYLVGSVGQEGGIIFNPEPPLNDVPVTPKRSPFTDWQQLAFEMSQGNVRVLMVKGANPWYGLPDDVGFKRASFNVPFIFSFSEFLDDTSAMADLILPDYDYLEAWGTDIPDPGPGYQTIGFQQPVVRPFFEARGEQLGNRAFADVLMTMANDLGIDLRLPGETFKEVVEDGINKLFALNRGSVTAGNSGAFRNGVLQRGGWWDANGRSSASVPTPPRLPDAEEPRFDGNREFHLIPFASVGLTDGSTSHLPWMQAVPDPITTGTWRTWVEINFEVAERMRIKEGDVIRVTSDHGSITALAFPHPGISPDIISIPIGQGHISSGRYAEGRGSNVYSILAPAVDGNSGALAWASTKVTIQKTGAWVRLPKFENTVPEFPEDEEGLVVKVTAEDA